MDVILFFSLSLVYIGEWLDWWIDPVGRKLISFTSTSFWSLATALVVLVN